MATFTPLQETVLFKPLRLGSLNLEHRVVLAPLTRMRGTKESDGVFVPNDLSVEYYSQRASKGGFMLTEATPISRYVSFTSSRIECGEVKKDREADKKFILSVRRISRRSWHIHRFSDCGMEACHRCRPC